MGLPQISFKKHVIDDSFVLSKKIYVADVDQDGDLDIVATSSNFENDQDNVALWEDVDGKQNFVRHSLTKSYFGGRGIIATQLDGQGYLEIIAGNRPTNKPILLSYQSENWVVDSLGISPGASNYSFRIGDLDADGIPDILTTYGRDEHRLLWFRNNGSLDFTEVSISDNIYFDAVDIVSGVVDNDSFVDIVAISATPGDVTWWKNDGTPEDGGWTKNFIQPSFDGANSVEYLDIDGDGFPDVLAAAWFAHKISWWRNLGNGNFDSERIIINNYLHARNAIAADVDGDGDLDIVAAADSLNEITWFENDGNQSFTRHIINSNFQYAYMAFPIDLDGDGDVDVVASAQNDGEVAWWENRLEDREFIASESSGPHSFWNDLVEVNFTNGPNDTLRVFYNAGTVPDRQSLAPGVDHLAQKGYYTISTPAGSYDGSIDFYYGAGYVPEWTAISNPNDLVICVWDTDDSVWKIAVDQNSQTVFAGENRINVQGITNEFKRFSKWTLGSVSSDNPLPVQLLAFTAHSANDGVKLQWTTASEINNLGYELWRAAKPDSGYVRLASYLTHEALQGAGNSNRAIDYEFLDTDVRNGTTYSYLLVDVNFDNQKASHGPIEITYRSEALLARTYQLGQNFPNPFNGATRIPVHISGEGQGKKPARLIIYDITGRQVRSFDLSQLGPGINMIEWDGRDQSNRMVASGVYIYSLFANGEMQSKRLQFIK